MNQIIPKSIYSINSIYYPCKLPSTLGFETQCQTYFSNLQDGNKMRIVDELTIDRITIGRGVGSRGFRGNPKGIVFVDHSNTLCKRCGGNKTRPCNEDGTRPQWFKYKINENSKFDINGKWTGEYLCNMCYNVLSRNRKYVNKELSPDTNVGKGFIGEQIFSKVRGVKNCNIESGNFHNKQDHSIDKDYGIVNTKIATVSKIKVKDFYYDGWKINPHGEYDNLCIICMSMEWYDVERVYIIPIRSLGNKTGIAIYKSSNSKWEKYRVDEKSYNDAYHSMSLKDCPILKSDITSNRKRDESKDVETKTQELETKNTKFNKKVFKILKQNLNR